MANANSLLLAIQLPLLKRATEGKRRVEMENAWKAQIDNWIWHRLKLQLLFCYCILLYTTIYYYCTVCGAKWVNVSRGDKQEMHMCIEKVKNHTHQRLQQNWSQLGGKWKIFVNQLKTKCKCRCKKLRKSIKIHIILWALIRPLWALKYVKLSAWAIKLQGNTMMGHKLPKRQRRHQRYSISNTRHS